MVLTTSAVPVTFEDGFRVIVRFPILGRSRFRIEKSENEVFMMLYLYDHTNIPVPQILGAGNWGLGPYMVMTFIEGGLMSNRIESSLSLDPTISGSDIEHAFRGMAHVLLEFSKPVFPYIGAITKESRLWKVGRRPLSLNMNELVSVGNVPPNKFSNQVFRTASEYFHDLAERHLLHLEYQRNDAVDDESDCRKKYIARCLFRKITRQIPLEESGPFHLYCDDLRPSNVLVSDSEQTLTINSVIDWEYTYVAPVEFTQAAPWWLLFESPESWESDLNKFLLRYMPRLEIFLNILRSCEDEQIKMHAMEEHYRLSNKMAESMENGNFWVCLAARKSFMFDDIYWTFLDQRYFGDGSPEDRISPLTQEELDELERLVPLKMQQAIENTLEEHLTYDEYVDL
ncbi:phosphotransferase enzyme family protein [Penicillium malachiteum]|uniref:Phosphotransferase enzyme family protein n=1 Tax=Penicillium malachiteum TaxID=1324776 RepID=A0AAD6MW52_9EURO|nr:phosphotransferase enzyme family protein [Penicillium malachiteum]